MGKSLISAFVIGVALVIGVSARAQLTEADSTADALLRRTDDVEVDNESIFDEIEALADDIRLRSQTRIMIDPSAREESGNLGQAFLGSPLETLEKLEGHSDPLGGGFVGQKDAWEKSYVDDWAAYLEVREPIDIAGVTLSRAEIGSYALRFGSGLIFGSGLASASTRANPGRLAGTGTPLRHSLSGHSLNSLFGGGLAVSLRNFSVIPFYSRRSLDARLDTLGVQTLYTYLHRTSEETAFRNALGVRVAGVHVGYDDTSVTAGVTLVNTTYDEPLHTTSSHLVTGRTLDHAGIDAGVHFNAVEIVGEAAMAKSNGSTGVAAIASIVLHPSNRLSVRAIYHRQDTNYYAPYGATALNSVGDLTNEEGYWLGLTSKVMPGLDFSGAIEMSRKLSAMTAARATPTFDEFVDARFTGVPLLDLDVRYRYRDRTTLDNAAGALAADDERGQSNVRLIANYEPTPSIAIELRTEGTSVHSSLKDKSEHGGFLQIASEYRGELTRLSLMVARFSTDSYDSRVYTYTSELSGVGAIVLMNGKGWFTGVRLEERLLRWLTLEGYAGGSVYDAAREFGSGLTRRAGRTDVTLGLQLTAQP